MKCAIYRRVSTNMQAEEGISLEMQKTRLEAYATSQNWIVVQDYCDEGFSAKSTDRPSFKRMMSDMKKKKFDIILVYRLDRFTRSVGDLHALLEKMDKQNVKFKSSTEVFDTTTATGRLFITLVATLAQWERETIAERVRDAMQKKAESGMRNGGKPPYGYDLVNGKLVINEKEAFVVKFIYSSYKTKGIQSIAKTLNQQGYKTKNNSSFTYDTVNYILNNPVYIGKIRWGDDVYTDNNQDDFTPLISLTIWNEVQDIMKQRKHNKTRTQNFFPFSGVLRCNRCGKHFLGNKQDRGNGRFVNAYRCSSRAHLGLCDMPQVPEDVLQNEFLRLIGNIQVEEELKIEETERIKPLNTLQDQLKQIENKKNRLKELYIEGDITKQDYKKRIQDLTLDENNIYQQLDEVEDRVTAEETSSILLNLKNEWEFLSDESKKAAVNSLIERLVIEVTQPAVAGRNPLPPTIKLMDIQFV